MISINSLCFCSKKQMSGLMEHFETVTDPRMERRKLHKLHDIIFITIAAVVCGCDEWNDIEEFGTIRCEWLKTILELPSGIPSHDTFNRVFSLLDPQQLQQCWRSMTTWRLNSARQRQRQPLAFYRVLRPIRRDWHDRRDATVAIRR